MKVKDASQFSSSEMRKILKVSDCELMHLRTSGELQYQRSGNAFLYSLPKGISLLAHPLGKQLLEWHIDKHPQTLDNTASAESRRYLEMLIKEILIPVEREFSELKITYGFTSSELARYIKMHSSTGTAPSLDQHSACEQNQKGNLVCERGGSACDFIVNKCSMADVTRFITKQLNFDRLYFYGEARPIHVSVNDQPNKHLQVMSESATGRRIPGRKAFGDAAFRLSEEL